MSLSHKIIQKQEETLPEEVSSEEMVRRWTHIMPKNVPVVWKDVDFSGLIFCVSLEVKGMFILSHLFSLLVIKKEREYLCCLDFHILVTIIMMYKIGKEGFHSDFLCFLLLFTTTMVSWRKGIAILDEFGEFRNNSVSLGLHDSCHYPLCLLHVPCYVLPWKQDGFATQRGLKVSQTNPDKLPNLGMPHGTQPTFQDLLRCTPLDS